MDVLLRALVHLAEKLPAMATISRLLASSLFMGANTAYAASLADIDHVVLFMQENRAFDHYFGTMAGVRGFSDPNVQVNDAVPVWEQKYEPKTGTTGYLMPWYINYLGGEWNEATQCMLSGSNAWDANHDALNGGKNDQWPAKNTVQSWGHFEEKDIPVQFAIANAWTVGDMYQEGIIASTCPNRVNWLSGTVTTPGTSTIYVDNNESPGCESPGLNCYPLTWETAAEQWSKAGVEWQVYQDTDNFDDNAFAYFDQFQKAANGSDLSDRGMAFLGLQAFYDAAAKGNLPAISYIVGPMELSEHPPYSPHDGAWLQKNVVDAVTSSPKYNRTALFISYDETGGWGDHVVPYHSPEGTALEWVPDPYTDSHEQTYVGPGFRLPFYIVSPYTRGGAVFTEPSDHNSQLLFVEKWLAAKGKKVTTPNMIPWRRAHMSDLTGAFDFANPDASVPDLPPTQMPSKNAQGEWDGSVQCEAQHANRQPPAPYNTSSLNSEGAIRSAAASLSQKGFKEVRGRLTEGRFLTFEAKGFALTNPGKNGKGVTAKKAAANRDDKSQQWVVHQPDAGLDSFTVSSASDGRWVAKDGSLSSDQSKAASVTIKYNGGGKGYSLQGLKTPQGAVAFDLYSVT